MLSALPGPNMIIQVIDVKTGQHRIVGKLSSFFARHCVSRESHSFLLLIIVVKF